MKPGIRNYQFIGVRLPYGEQADEEDAKKAIEFIKPDIELRVNIKAAVDAQVQAVEEAGLAVSDFNKGNIKARQRMITQYAIAGEKQELFWVRITLLKISPASLRNTAMAVPISYHCFV